MANDKDMPKGFQEGTPWYGRGSGKSVRYVPIAMNYPVRMPEDRSFPFTSPLVTKEFGSLFGPNYADSNDPDMLDFVRALTEGDIPRNTPVPEHLKRGENSQGVMDIKKVPFHLLTPEQLREMAWMPKDRKNLRDFGIWSDPKTGNLTSLARNHMRRTAEKYDAGRRHDSTKYEREKAAKMVEFLDDFKMDKILGVDWLTQKIPVDDPNRESKIAYMNQVRKAYENNADFFLNQQVNHAQANQAQVLREALARRRAKYLKENGLPPDPMPVQQSKDPLTGNFVPMRPGDKGPTTARVEHNPIWENIALQMNGELTGAPIDRDKSIFFGTDRNIVDPDIYTIDDQGINAPAMNRLHQQKISPNTSKFELGMLDNGIESLWDSRPRPVMGSSFEHPDTSKMFGIPPIVQDLIRMGIVPAPGSVKPVASKPSSSKSTGSEWKKQFSDFGAEAKAAWKGAPLSAKVGLPLFTGISAGALATNALRKAQKQSNNFPSLNQTNRDAGDYGPVKGRRATTLNERFGRFNND